MATSSVTFAAEPALDPPPTDPVTEDQASVSEAQAAVAELPASALELELLRRFDDKQLSRDYVALEIGSGRFLARYEAASAASAEGAVLLVPGIAQLITKEQIIDALLQEFPANGWAVMAIQLGLLPAGSATKAYAQHYPDVLARLQQACAYLQANGIRQIVIIGLEGGASYARQFLAEVPQSANITGLATRGYWQGEADDVTQPVIEFVGELDDDAIDLAVARQKKAKRAARAYRLQNLAGIGRDTLAMDAEIAKYLRGWVKTAVLP